jgi:hypothetical protein
MGFTFVYFGDSITQVGLYGDADFELYGSLAAYRLAAYYGNARYSSGSYYRYRRETNAGRLAKLSSLLLNTSYADMPENFAATNAYIITWYMYPAASNTNLKNSMQMILATDGVYSFLACLIEQIDAAFNVPTEPATVYSSLPGYPSWPGWGSPTDTNCGVPGLRIFRVDGRS